MAFPGEVSATTDAFDVCHVDWAVTSWLDPSESCARAESSMASPTRTDADDVASVTALSVAGAVGTGVTVGAVGAGEPPQPSSAVNNAGAQPRVTVRRHERVGDVSQCPPRVATIR